MNLSDRLDQLHLRTRQNKWMGYFATLCRFALAWGFLPSGMQKVIGERFTVLAVNHPMGHYLDAFYQTGYYYTFVGLMQVTAAILLLIPRTVTLGALIYFPIVLNICILSLSVRFDGSGVTSPLMVLAVLYLLCWDYHKLRFIFPFSQTKADLPLPPPSERGGRFPVRFFSIVVIVAAGLTLRFAYGHELMPHNSLTACQKQCPNKDSPAACQTFCDCIHMEGQPLYECLEAYERE